MDTIVIAEPEVQRNHMAVMGAKGDQKTMWDPTRPDEVEVARDTFNKLTKKNYSAFRVKPEDGNAGERMTTFDPSAGKIILVPQMAGG